MNHQGGDRKPLPMSLEELVVQVASEMESDADEIKDTVISRLMRAHARTLRTAVRVESKNTPPGGIPIVHQAITGSAEPPRGWSPAAQEFIRRQREQERAAQESAAEAVRQEHGLVALEFADGPLEGDMTTVGSRPPVGSKSAFMGAVYQYRADGKLYHLPDEKVQPS